jgi:hypothetical protein
MKSSTKSFAPPFSSSLSRNYSPPSQSPQRGSRQLYTAASVYLVFCRCAEHPTASLNYALCQKFISHAVTDLDLSKGQNALTPFSK